MYDTDPPAQWLYLIVMMLEVGISRSPISRKKLACRGLP